MSDGQLPSGSQPGDGGYRTKNPAANGAAPVGDVVQVLAAASASGLLTTQSWADVYTKDGVDSLIAGIGALTAEDIDTLAEINAIINDANLQELLVSGTNIKTVNSASLLGSGNISTKIPYYIEVALSANGKAIVAGTKKGMARVHTAGTITGFVIDCDPANKPSATSVQVDLNTINRTTAVATSVLSAVASIATGGSTGTGTVSGTPSVAAGDLLTLDIDQGSDGKELLATIEITPS